MSSHSIQIVTLCGFISQAEQCNLYSKLFENYILVNTCILLQSKHYRCALNHFLLVLNCLSHWDFCLLLNTFSEVEILV